MAQFSDKSLNNNFIMIAIWLRPTSWNLAKVFSANNFRLSIGKTECIQSRTTSGCLPWDRRSPRWLKPRFSVIGSLSYKFKIDCDLNQWSYLRPLCHHRRWAKAHKISQSRCSGRGSARSRSGSRRRRGRTSDLGSRRRPTGELE